MTILLLGSNGQVGFELQRTLPGLGCVTAIDMPDIDFTQPESLKPLVREIHPHIIVNAAAYTAVDNAEGDAHAAYLINAVAPRVLAEEAKSLRAILIHYSTDYIFDGTKTSPYVESDEPNPLSVYGQTKLEGERAVAAYNRSLTLRTSWVIGSHGKNFIQTILRIAAKMNTLRVVNDQFGAPTSAALLADVTTTILRQIRPEDSRYGLYHVAASGQTTWYELAQRIIASASTRAVPLATNTDRVIAIPTSDYPTPARRPANSRLDTHKLHKAFGIDMPDWTIGTDVIIDQIISARSK